MKTLLLLFVLSISIIFPHQATAQNPTISCTQYPSGIQTPSARDPNLVDQEAYQAEGATWDYRWEADCSHSCSNNSDCIQNTSNQPAVKPEGSAWCFQFTNGNRCMILTTTDKGAGSDKNASGGRFGQYGATETSSSSQPAGTGTSSLPGNLTNPQGDTSPACREVEGKRGETEKAFYDAKVANNLVRFNTIVKGVPELCVPADLGATETQETATAGLFSGRLLLCSGAAKPDGSLPDLVWRIIVGPNLFKPDKEPPSRESLEAGFAPQVSAAKAKLGL